MASERILGTRILIVGVGGLGVPAVWALVRDGAREVTLVDPDPVYSGLRVYSSSGVLDRKSRAVGPDDLSV